MQTPFEALLRYYQIEDFQRQILGYHETYRNEAVGKVMARDELERCLETGFYIGHYKTGLGEFLSYTPVPRFLKTYYPEAKVYVCGHRFADALFRNNPHVDGVVDLKDREPFGTFREFGFGTQPQRRVRAFGIYAHAPVAPEITISSEVRQKWGDWRARLPLGGRKLVIVQSSGRTNPKLFSAMKWWRLLRALRDEYYFVQIGNLRDQFIWAHKILFKTSWDIEDMAGLLGQGDAFIGPNSGVMHLAAAVGVNAVILHNEAQASEMQLPLLGDGLALPKKDVNGHLFHVFPWHHHLMVDERWDNGAGPFAQRLTVETLRRSLQGATSSDSGGENPVWTQLKSHFTHEPVCIYK